VKRRPDLATLRATRAKLVADLASRRKRHGRSRKIETELQAVTAAILREEVAAARSARPRRGLVAVRGQAAADLFTPAA
jgi:hypothetical protein